MVVVIFVLIPLGIGLVCTLLTPRLGRTVVVRPIGDQDEGQVRKRLERVTIRWIWAACAVICVVGLVLTHSG